MNGNYNSDERTFKYVDLPLFARENAWKLYGGAPVSARVLSKRLREGLLNYKLLPNEKDLAHLLCLETLDCDQIRGRVTLEAWARALGMFDAKGLRPDKCEKVLKNLVDLGIVDLNAAQGTYELRPHAEDWSRLRSFRCAERPKTEGELSLLDERPLSEALSENSREKAAKAEEAPPQCVGGESSEALSDDSAKALLGSGPGPDRDWPALFQEMRELVGSEALEDFMARHPEMFSADKSADSSEKVRRINPPTGAKSSADKSADIRLNSPTHETPANIDDSAPSGFSAKSAETFGGVGGAAAHAAAAAAALIPVCTPKEAAAAAAAVHRTVPVHPATQADAAAAAAAAFLEVEKTGNKAAAAVSADKSADALAWLQSVDYKGRLENENTAAQFFDLCNRTPNYVLYRLKPKLETHEANGNRVNDPLAWLSRKARDEGKIRS